MLYRGKGENRKNRKVTCTSYLLKSQTEHSPFSILYIKKWGN